MYLWKCWRDTRSIFLVIVGAMLANSALGLFVYYDPFGWIAAKAEWPRTLWQTTTQALLLFMPGVTPIAGFVLGTVGVGSEFERRTADFLLTRPRSRRYFLWTSWGLGTAEILALTALGLSACWIAGFRFAPPRTLRVLVSMYILALVIYSITYLMTTLARNTRNGLGLSLLVFSAYGGVCVWLRYWYEIQVPVIFELMASGGRRGGEPATILGWLVVGLVAVAVAQFAFERQEV